MLNEAELEIVQKSRIHGFGAYLQKSWFNYYSIVAKVKDGNFPTPHNLEEIFSGMHDQKTEFDIVYFMELPEAKVNPLKEEQEAWKRLSPDVGKFLNGFKRYLSNYSQENTQEESKLQFQSYLDIWWAFLQEWNTISNSYKPKVQEVYSQLARKGVRRFAVRKPQH